MPSSSRSTECGAKAARSPSARPALRARTSWAFSTICWPWALSSAMGPTFGASRPSERLGRGTCFSPLVLAGAGRASKVDAGALAAGRAAVCCRCGISSPETVLRAASRLGFEMREEDEAFMAGDSVGGAAWEVKPFAPFSIRNRMCFFYTQAPIIMGFRHKIENIQV